LRKYVSRCKTLNNPGLINVGFGNMVASSRVVAIVNPESSPVKRLVQEAREKSAVIDATQGRRTRAVIITDSGHILLSAIQPETIAGRLGQKPLLAETEH